jgi:hypothetical protein
MGFILFLAITTTLVIIFCIIFLTKYHEKGANIAFGVIYLIIGFLGDCFVLLLVFFHFMIMFSNLTTNEYCKKTW